MAGHYFSKRDSLGGFDNKIVVIPLHLPLNYACDYIDQTANVLKKKCFIILFDFQNPYSWKQLLNGGFIDLIENIKKIFNLKVGAVHFRSPSFFPFQSHGIICELNKTIGTFLLRTLLAFNHKQKLIWRFYPELYFGIRNLGKGFYIYDCIDYLSPEKRTIKHANEERLIINHMDLISFNSVPLFTAKIAQYPHIKNRSISTVCGCNVNLFNKKTKLKNMKHGDIRVFCFGNIDYRFDFELYSYLLKNNPSMKFLLLGRIDQEVQSFFKDIQQYSNFTYLGFVPKERLLKYVQYASVGIIPYKTNLNFVRYSNPMKTYEYLALGIPVVSTKIEALTYYPNDIVFTADKYADFSDALTTMTSNWDSAKKRTALSIAKDNSWDNKIYSIERYLKNTDQNADSVRYNV